MACCLFGTKPLVPNRQQAITWTSDNPVCWCSVVSQDHDELKFAIGSCVILWLNWYSWDRNDISFCFTITLHCIIAIDLMINLMSAYWNTANYVGHTVLLLQLAAMHILCVQYICDILSISTYREKYDEFVKTILIMLVYDLENVPQGFIMPLQPVIMKWKHFPNYWPFVWGIHQSPMDSSHWGRIMSTFGDLFVVSLNKLFNNSFHWFEMIWHSWDVTIILLA